ETATHSEHVPDQDVHVEAWTARIDPPPAVDGDRASLDAFPLRARLIAVVEGGVAAAEIGVALSQRRMAQTVRDGDRIGDHERLPQRLRFAEVAHRLAIAEVRMRIHEPDLAAEERCRFGPAEGRLRAAVIGDWLLHQAGAVREQEMFADEGHATARVL